MALHFIFGRAGTGKTTRCCEDIARYMTEAPGRSALFLVPDQATYLAESTLARAFPGKGFLGVSVCGFSRLAYRVFQELHSDTNEALSPLVQQLVLRRLLLERKKDLRMMAAAAARPHFAQSLTSFFHQLSSFLITEEDLSAAAREEGDTPLGKKLSDLSLLYGAYHEYLSSHFRYRGNMYDKLAADIPRSEALRKTRIWIDGFGGMTPQEIAIAAALIRTAPEVTVTLSMDPPEESARYPLFDRPYRLWQALSRAAGHASSVTLTEMPRCTSPRLKDLAVHFFTPFPRASTIPPAEKLRADEGLYITKAPSRAAEADTAARQIARLIREKGFRCRDILVLLRKADAYTDLVRRAFEKARIPVFIDQRQPMRSHPLVMLLENLLQFLSARQRGPWQGWRRSLLFPLLKTDLLRAFSPEEVDRLENYVLRIGIRPRQWGETWKFHSPFHLEYDDGMPTPQEREELNLMNALRSRLLDFLIPLEDRWHEAETVREKCTLLYQWLMEQKVPDTLALWDMKEFEKSREKPHLQVWKKVLQLLNDMVRAAGSDILPDKEFLAIAEDGLGSLTYAMIPPTLDHVTVTTIDRGSAMEGRAVFLLGAAEGDFPSRIAEEGFLTTAEARRLAGQSLILGPDLLGLIYQEEFYAYLSLTRARQVLYISYPASDNDGTALSPSPLIERMGRLGYATAMGAARLPDLGTKDPSFLLTPDQSLSLLPDLARKGIPAADSLWPALVSWAKAAPERAALLSQKLRGLSYESASRPLPASLSARLFLRSQPFRTSVTRLESYRSCPYKYFLQYGLSLNPQDQSRMDNRDYGNYLHAGLHSFGDYLKKQKKEWRNASDEEIDRISAEIARRVAPRVKSGALVSDAAAAYTEGALNRTFKAALRRFRTWSRQSSASTIAMEESFRLSIGESRRFFVDCHIDRVDAAGSGAIVYDYKTGRPDISLQEIVTACRLQLITYLMAVWENKKDSLLPGAILYIYLNGDTRSVPVPGNGKKTALPKELAGYFLDDADFLSALDHDLCGEDTFLPLARTKKGAWSARSPVLTLDQMEALFAVTRKNLAALYEKIKSGAIPIRPVRTGKGSTPCQWCLYKSICRFDPKLPGCRYEDIPNRSDKDILSELTKEESHE